MVTTPSTLIVPRLSIVYIFYWIAIVGAWNDVISSAQDIVTELKKLSDGKLTASGGIGIYESKYPVAAFAVETEELESCAKHIDKYKSAVTLFEASKKSTYHWDVFEKKVLNDKLDVLQRFIKTDENGKGMSFVYKLLEYLRGCDSDRINIARVAYLLGRMWSEKGISNVSKMEAKVFRDKIYDWITNDTDRQQLITAIYIFVYSERKDKDGKEL